MNKIHKQKDQNSRHQNEINRFFCMIFTHKKHPLTSSFGSQGLNESGKKQKTYTTLSKAPYLSLCTVSMNMSPRASNDGNWSQLAQAGESRRMSPGSLNSYAFFVASIKLSVMVI